MMGWLRSLQLLSVTVVANSVDAVAAEPAAIWTSSVASLDHTSSAGGGRPRPPPTPAPPTPPMPLHPFHEIAAPAGDVDGVFEFQGHYHIFRCCDWDHMVAPTPAGPWTALGTAGSPARDGGCKDHAGAVFTHASSPNPLGALSPSAHPSWATLSLTLSLPQTSPDLQRW